MGTFLDIALAAALVLLLGRTTFRRGPNAGSMALIVVVGAVALWRGLGPGAGWLVPFTFVVLALALLQIALAVAVLSRIRLAAPADLHREILAAAGRPDGPRLVVLAVAPFGTVLVQGVTDDPAGASVRLSDGCPICFVEGVALAVLDDDAAVAAYRGRLAGGDNQLFRLTRGVIDDRWQAELRPVNGPRKPFRPVACPVHPG
ncbi:hypothetical protein [Kitasatospora sp. NPDC085879]|jgi:hypothetical protein|uniref:hypothetical protein n=1 Tax=Kitasatospora sp. NPDC085879 TaxID=3154769 RepID=UPI000BB0F0A7|nr:hypothetical protein [Streptomyces sp. TLI_235]PBC76808.1 hypothetical protein BX265_1529 [Streptomyces sp. TLI_235]